VAEETTGLADRQLLAQFLVDLKYVLSAFLELRGQLLPAHLRELSVAAWESTDQAFSILQRLLLEPEDPILLVRRLRDVGLTDAPLRYKLAGFDRARQRKQPIEPRKSRSWYRRIFGWANIILGSLAKVLPPAEIIKEFKESAEQGIADAEEDFRNSRK